MSLVLDWIHVFKISKKIAFWDILSGIYLYPKFQNKMTYSFVKKKDQAVTNYIKKNFNDLINAYRQVSTDSLKPAKKVVWTVWWQGECEAPPMIRGCIASIRKCFFDYEVIVVTKDNYKDYIDIPALIMDKVEKKQITFIHLSDFIRVSLLARYGGIWADATLYCSDVHPNIEAYEFFTLRDEMPAIRYWPCKGRWNVYFMCSNSVGYPLFSFMRDVFIEYCKKEDYLVEYFLIDYMISVAYDEFPYIRKQIDKVPITTHYQDELVGYLNDCFSIKKYRYLLKVNWASKLNRHHDYMLQSDGEQTFYSFMFKKYLQ